MKILFVYVFFSTLILFASLRELSAQGMIAPEVLDSVQFQVLYKVNQKFLKEREAQIVIDTMALDIGKVWSVYYNLLRDKRDSLDTHYRYNKRSDARGWWRFQTNDEALQARLEAKKEPVDIQNQRKFGEPAKIFKNREKKEIITIDDGPLEMPDTHTLFRFTESIPPQNWKIEDDTLTVMNYLCQKAIAEFRGRSYIVWFTTDIPINDGPWKLYGLPGLILKAKDDKEIFDFEAIGLKRVSNELIRVVLEMSMTLRDRHIIYKRKFIGGNLKQWQAYRKERFKNISIGFLEGNDVYYYKTKNPITYIEMEIED